MANFSMFSPGAMLKIGPGEFAGKRFYIHSSSGAHAQIHISAQAEI